MKVPASLKAWAETTVPENATADERHSIVTQKLTDKLLEYQVEYRLKLGLVDGSLSIPEGCTVGSILAKSDEASVAAFNEHAEAILNECVFNDTAL